MVSTLLTMWIALAIPPDMFPVRIPRGEYPLNVSDDPRPAGAAPVKPPVNEDR